MQNQSLIKIVAIAVVVLTLTIWWWPSRDETAQTEPPAEGGRKLVSAIQPINDADALTLSGELPEITTEPALAAPDESDQQDFDRALVAIQSGDYATADSLLKQLIQRQPGLLEPYINLASVQAARGDLAAARSTLNAGLSANQNYSALYQNLKKVHAALAAQAYRQALAEDAGSTLEESANQLELPVVANLNPSVSPEDPQALKRANEQIVKLESDLRAQQSLLAQRQQELVAANTSLERELQSAATLKTQLQNAESAASQTTAASLAAADDRITTLNTELAKAQARIEQMERAHQSEIAKMTTQIDQQRETIAQQTKSAELEEQKLNAQIAALTEAAKNQSTQAAAVAATSSLPATTTDNSPGTRDDSAEKLAIERVKSWAAAWSNQDVESYIEHYRDGYTPTGSSMSHADWRAQRRVRLTNKRFIEVSISNFETSREGDEVSVTFTQRYRSNTMDDTIRKRLVFNNVNNNWERAKIVSERVIR